MDTSNVSSPRRELKKYGGIALTALLVFSIAAVAMAGSSSRALAQAVPTISTSTNTFFGNNIVQVIVTDSAKNSVSTSQESTSVTVRVRDNTGAIKGTDSISAFELGTNSGQFEFFIATGTQDPATPRSLVATGTTAVSGGPIDTAAKAPVFRFNAAAPTAGTNDKSIATTSTPADGWKVEIEYSGAASVKTLSFEPSSMNFNLDRTTAGSGANTIFQLTDQDGNNDPTAVDTIVSGTITATAVPLGSSNLLTGQFTAGGTLTLTETGANTGVFEVTRTTAQLGSPAFTSPSTANYVARDYDVYANPTGGSFAVASTTSTVTKSLVFQNQDGTLTPLSQITFASELPLNVTDSDLNDSTRSKDTLTSVTATPVGVTVSVDATGGDSEQVNLKETGDNTNVFAADLNKSRLPVSFINSGTPTANNGVLELRVSDITGGSDILASYADPNTSTGATNTQTSTIRLPVSHTAGQMSFDNTQATATGKINAVLNDPDLNNNPDAIDSYTVALSGATSPYGFTGFDNIAGIAVKIKGVSTATTAPTTAQTIVFIETGPNTGVFKAEVDVAKLSTSFSDGDQVEFKYRDSMETPTADSTATFTIGKPATAVTVDRTTLGIPLLATEPSTMVAGTPSADSIKFRLTITDASKNTDSGVQETITAAAVDAGSATNDISLATSGGTALSVGTATTNTIAYSGFPLTETGPNTGVFSGMITLTRGTATDSTLANLDNAKLTIKYDNNVATVTLRPSNLVITTDKSIVSNGGNMTVTITDLDRNLDSENRDTIPFLIETKSDSLTGAGATFSSTATETGPNTGVFTKNVRVGVDIKLTSVGTSVTQATELKISSTDRVSTDRTSTDRDLAVKVGTTSGSVTVTPEVVGPGTKLALMVADNDLNVNPAGVDTIPSTTDYVTVTTDRSNFPTTKVAGEETGPNTGLFKTTIKLKPKTTASTVAPATPTGTKDLTNFEVLPGDLISVKYIDTKDVSGNKVTISKVVQVVSQDPKMNATKAAFAANDAIGLTVTDVDANTDGEAIDSVKVRVTSTSDPVGFDVTGLETGVNTGVFTFSVPTTTSVSSGSITVKNGDNVTFKYTDTYPADYAERVKQVADPSKDFLLNVGIGAVASINATTPSQPALKDITGSTINEVTTGQQVVLSTDIKNNNNVSQPFAAIVEVRDADGITVYLQWQTGTLNPSSTANVGLSWTPENAGTYSVRTFVISNLANPAVLSPVAESTITVS